MSASLPASAPWTLRILVAAIALFASWVLPTTAGAQTVGSRAVPKMSYFAVFPEYYDGNYEDALRDFRRSARDGVVSTAGRWVDAICYHTMVGECYYHMANLPKALDQYNTALQLLVTHRQWMLRVQFPPTITASASVRRASINWGRTIRRTVVARIPDTMLSLQGRPDNQQVLKQGGVIALPELYPLRVAEIIRCAALSLRRRRELMGPAGAHDPFSAQLVQALSAGAAPANHWSGRWVDALLGLAYACGGHTAQAVERLNRGILMAGQFDHSLTPTILLELGKLALEQQKYKAAATFFLEATFVAVPFSQADVMEEAFRWGAITHIISNQRGVYPPLVPAAAWSRAKRFRSMQTSLLLLASEGYAIQGDLARASSLWADANRLIARRQMREGRLGARHQYQAALIRFKQGSVAEGHAVLSSAMAYMRNGSRRLFQISLVDKLYLTGTVSPRVANELFADVLREPTAVDWRIEPMETLAVCVTPHPLPMEHWFGVALTRKEHDTALEIADQMRRQRFYNSLPLGGRLLGLRWVLEAPETALSDAAKRDRQNLRVDYPAYVELSQKAAAIREAVAREDVLPDDPQLQRSLAGPLKELAIISALQETMLREMAIRRQPCERAFPPRRSAKDIQEQLRDGQIVLVFFATSRSMHAFAMSKDEYSHWLLDKPAALRTQVANLLRAMGNYDANSSLDNVKLSDEGWKQLAAEMLKSIIRGADPDEWDQFKELIIVPDGPLWYLPFESLQIADANGSRPLIASVRMRYVPTLSMAMPDGRGRKPTGRTAIVQGKLLKREDDEISEMAAQQLLRALPDSALLRTPLAAPSSLSAKFWERLIVLDDVDDGMVLPFDWSPVQLDRGKPGSKLADWFSLPWGGPDQVLLPGFHTAAEDSLKQSTATGGEVFLAVCGLMSTGTRTILLSRWRCGGQTSYDLVREFAQELPHTDPASAWQRSVQLTMQSELDPTREPRVRVSRTEIPLRAEAPFFWAGYMLVDTGAMGEVTQ